MLTPALPRQPTPRMVDDALNVITHPELFHAQPALRVSAWATLKSQRGQRVNQLRLDLMLRALRPVSSHMPMLGGAV